MNQRLIIRYIETTGKCNYNCPMCVCRNRNNDMSERDFYSIITENRELLNGQRTWLDFCGEPLMDPFLFERIQLLCSVGTIVQLSTNGALLEDDEMIRKLVESGVDYIVVSIPSLNPKTYKELRGVDNLDQILCNLFKLREYIAKSNYIVQLQAVAVDFGNDFDAEEYVNFFHNKGIHVAIHQFTNRAHNSQIKNHTSPNLSMERKECLGLKQNIAILSNCEVVTCCCDFLGENSLGNLRDFGYSVTELVKNSNLDKMIDDQKHRIYNDFCQKCEDWIYHQKTSNVEYVKLYPCNTESKYVTSHNDVLKDNSKS